jgi:putative hydrolases of HD superfamily
LCDELFRAFYIQRWNDRIRPMDLIEMDKHAHKMIIAYCFGKYEEEKGNSIDWNRLIMNGIFELLRRIIISDIKSPIFARITRKKEVFHKLNQYVFNELKNSIIDNTLLAELFNYIFERNDEEDLTSQILSAAHIYASYWEFQIIKQSNPPSYQNIRIETELLNKIDKYSNLEGITRLNNRHTIINFIELFGQLRFQIRWAQTPRIPRTSVLGHSLMVACFSYFFALENSACPKRLYNSFFGGLFHDLPEAVTRDIISPLKKSSEELEKLLKLIEFELAESEIYPLIEEDWIDEIKYYTVNEFNNKITEKDGVIRENITIGDLNKKYNSDIYNPYDGESVRAADQLSAFLEAWYSVNAGIRSQSLVSAANNIREIYSGKILGKISFSAIYKDFQELRIYDA